MNLASLSLVLAFASPPERTVVLPVAVLGGAPVGLARALGEALQLEVMRLVPADLVFGPVDLREIHPKEAAALEAATGGLGASERAARSLGGEQLLASTLGLQAGGGYLLSVRRIGLAGGATLQRGEVVVPPGPVEAIFASVRKVAVRLYPKPAEELALAGAGDSSAPPAPGHHPTAKAATDSDLAWRQSELLARLWERRLADRGEAGPARSARAGEPWDARRQVGWTPSGDELAFAGLTGYLVSPSFVLARPTALLWQRAVSDRRRTWDEALAYCRDLDLGGVRGFRLPDESELLDLVAPGPVPTIDPLAFPATPPGWYWTGALVLGFAQAVSFVAGEGYLSASNAHNYVRCVREAGALPDPSN